MECPNCNSQKVNSESYGAWDGYCHDCGFAWDISNFTPTFVYWRTRQEGGPVRVPEGSLAVFQERPMWMVHNGR